MQIGRTAVPMIRIDVDLREAVHLHHMLEMRLLEMKAGRHGSGSSITDEIRMIERWMEDLQPWIERFTDELARK